MKQKLLGVVGVFLMGFCFISLPQSTSAQTTKVWRTMQAGAHPPTVEAAQAQCIRSGVSTAECAEFASKLLSNQCPKVSVPDNTRYGFMNGAQGTQGPTLKMLGGNTPVLRCYLSSGRMLDWYHVSVIGARACNNVGEPILVSKASQLEVTSGPLMSSPKVFIQETQGITVHLCACPGSHKCHNDIYLPGNRAILLK